MQIARTNLARMAEAQEARAIAVLAPRLAGELGDAGAIGMDALQAFVRARVTAGRALGLCGGHDTTRPLTYWQGRARAEIEDCSGGQGLVRRPNARTS